MLNPVCFNKKGYDSSAAQADWSCVRGQAAIRLAPWSLSSVWRPLSNEG